MPKKFGFLRDEQVRVYSHYSPTELQLFDAWFNEMYGEMEEGRDRDNYNTVRGWCINAWMARSSLEEEDGGDSENVQLYGPEMPCVQDNQADPGEDCGRGRAGSGIPRRGGPGEQGQGEDLPGPIPADDGSDQERKDD